MFVKTTTVRRGNRSYRYLSLVEAYRDEQGKACHRTLYRLGEASRLRDSGEMDRIIAALTEHARGRWIDASDLEAQDAPAVGGIAAVRALWERLGLEEHFTAVAQRRRLSYQLADAVFAMVANRLCDPASKRKTVRWIASDVVAPEGFSFPALDHYYWALDQVEAAKQATETQLYARLTDLTNLDLRFVTYDLTSTFFEGSPAPSERFPSKAFGHSRDRRPDRPQVVIGLLTTGDGIPIAHHVFAGNTADVTTLPGVLSDLQQRFGVGRTTLVADRGLISEDNIAAVEQAGCDWVLATRLHHRPDVAAVLKTAAAAEDEQWVEVEEFHSRVLDTDHDGRRYLVVFSNQRKARDDRRRVQLVDKTERRLLALERRVARDELVEKTKIVAAAERILARSPVKRLFTYQADHRRFVYDYDHDALDYDEALAGHYVLATSLSREQASPAQVLARYRSLTEVEVRFRVLKDFLALRPVFHWTERRVRGHVAVCVIAAVIEALMRTALREADVHDPDLDDQHLSARRALEELDRIRQVTLDAEGTTIELVTRRSALQERILKAFGVDTSPWTRPTIH